MKRSLQTQNVTAEELIEALAADVDVFWLLFGSVLVFFMQTGFTMLEVGSVQYKNSKNILIKNVFDAALGAAVFWLVGYGIAYGDDEGEFVGTTFYGLKNFDDYGSWLFQWTFSATAVTIVSGAVAERISFEGYFLYAVTLTALVYPFLVHWTWSDGFMSAFRSDEKDELLFGCGAIDFAGSGVVHLTGGVAALIGVIFLGPRLGRFDNTPDFKLPDYAPIFQCLGTLILFVGWFGFNGVSTLVVSGGGSAVAAKAICTTVLSGSIACITSVMIGRFHLGYIDFELANNGLLAGLVAITSCCATVEMEGAFCIGLIASIFFYNATLLLKKYKIDDVVNACPVHGACGVWGVLAAGFFTTEDNYRRAYASLYSDGGDRAKHCAGVFYGGGGSQLAANIVLVLVILAWVGGTSVIIFGVSSKLGVLRIKSEKENFGLDYAHHSTLEQRELIKAASPQYAEISPDFVSGRGGKEAVARHEDGQL